MAGQYNTDRGLLDLNGQIAFVSGAGQGVGRAIALTLAQHGAGGVVVNDFDAERAEMVAEEIKDSGCQAIPIVADVGNFDAVQAAFARVAATLGSVTILVNNAGNAGPNIAMAPGEMFWETTPEQWNQFFRTNLYGVMNCCHAAMRQMVEQGKGRIVTIVSDAGRIGEPRLAAYSAAKAGASGFVRALAREAGRYGITCNAISLSTIEPAWPKPELEAFLESKTAKDILSRYVIRRLGKPEDVAHMTLYLCSQAAEWITGQTYPVNGGYTFAQ